MIQTTRKSTTHCKYLRGLPEIERYALSSLSGGIINSHF